MAFAVLVLVAWAAWPSLAEVVEVDDDGFVSAFTLQIGGARDRVYGALVDETAAWWDPAHTLSGDAANMVFVTWAGPSPPPPAKNCKWKQAVGGRRRACGSGCRAGAISFATSRWFTSTAANA